MNIGLSKVKTVKRVPAKRTVKAKAYPVATMEQLYCQYIECENFVASTEKMVAYGDQLFETFDNLVSLSKTAKRFAGSAEGMSVLNDLVGHEFGGSFEADDATQAAKTIWQRIGEFFQKIFVWIKNFFSRVLNFFGMADSRLNKTIEFLNNGEQVEAFDFISTTEETNNVISGIIGGDANQFFNGADESAINTKVNNSLTMMKLEGAKHINDAAGAKAEAERLLSMVQDWRTAKTSAANALKSAQTAVKNAQGKQNLPEAKLAQKKAAAFVKLINKAAAIDMRSVSSFLANCKFVKGSTAAKAVRNAPPQPASETK